MRVLIVIKLLPLVACLLIGSVFARSEQNWSVARRWNEQALAAIRLDTPHPPVHARNLFHLSVVIYDVWAAYDKEATGYLYRVKHRANDISAARREAISYAAYRILTERYSLSKSASKTLANLEREMLELGYDSKNLSLDPETPAGLGNLVAREVSASYLDDGMRQRDRYQDLHSGEGGYSPLNPPLVVALNVVLMIDANRWQPLAIENAVDQNGFPTGPIQKFLGSQCMGVRPFALVRSNPKLPWIDPGPRPILGKNGDAQFRDEVVDVILRSSQLGPDDGAEMDISPGSIGNNSLAANDGKGFATNPITGKAYEPNVVKRADFARVLAEFWADGPHSETPPGHWNVLANQVSDHPGFVKRIEGVGRVLDNLEWDAKVYFALNGALHDAACAAWSVKRYYDGGRPISFIRYMGQLGQCTDTNGPSYHTNGLPLVDGLIELVNPFTAQPGEKHAGLPIGKVAVLSWPGQPKDPTNHYSGAKWISAVDWVPYQKRNFVTPAFPGYISGHSTFSRAAAEVMTAITGSQFFPGGIETFTVPANTYLTFEKGPTEVIQLQWATYYDAADQAGQSRLWGGIHVQVDDFAGRKVGSQVGLQAFALARRYFDGSAKEHIDVVKSQAKIEAREQF